MKKIYFLSMITLVMMMALLPHSINAQAPVWDGSYAPWTHGSGTQADPYLIEHPWHLAWLAHQVNDSAYTYNGQYFRLTTDLDMNNLEWTPIGNSTTNCFKGNIDGDGHLIDNIKITATSGNVGLFGVINNASIINLEVKSTITTNTPSSYTYGPFTVSGGIVAIVHGSNNYISNCGHTGNVTHSGSQGGWHGGIIGWMNGEITLSNCHNYGNIKDNASNCNQNAFCSCESHLGGLIGYCNATATLTDCSNNGTVEGKLGQGNGYHYGSYTGGLIGDIASGITISISNSFNNGNITGEYSGGLVGRSAGQLNISNSYNTGTLLGGYYQGGLVGYSSTCTITNSYNTGSLSNGRNWQGGLIGSGGGNISISHCYNTGIIIAGQPGWNHSCGGIIGHSFGMTNISCSANIGNVIFNSNTSSSINHFSCGGIIGRADDNPITLDRCYNTAVVSAIGTSTNSYGNVGGLVGYLSASASNIHECYNTGAVSTGTNATYNRCGGLLGYNTGAGTSITNCYNVGSLSGGSAKGIMDYNSSYVPTLSNCYYLESCGGSSQTGAQAASSTLMKSSNFPYMLNNGVQAFVQDVSPYVNQGYPIFGDLVYAVSTQAATHVGVTKAMLHGYYAGGADVVGFEYRVNTAGGGWTTVTANIGSPVSYWLTGLQSNTSYVFRFVLQKNGEVYYGEEKTFTTGTCNLTANITPSSAEMCQGVATPLTASGQSSLGDYFIYSWNTGSTAATLNIYNGGTYTVNVSDTNGCSATASINVVAHSVPSVNISGNTYLCLGESSQLTASGGNTYIWSTGTNTPSITVNHGGTYTVTATNTYGCSNTASVTVVSLENLGISGNTHICSGQSTTLSVNGAGSHAWSTGANTSSISVSNPGTYTVTATLPNGCSSSTSVVVTTASLPTPTIAGSTSICQGQTTSLTATGGSTYLWSNGSTTNLINVSQSGIYAVTATNADGCSASANVTVTVNPLPTVSISGVNSICQGQNTSLTANGGNTYAWSSGSSTPSITVSQGGVYTVTATNTAGCSATEEITVTVKPLPNVSISGNSSFCQGDYTLLTATGANTYLWNNNSTLETITVNNAGNYTVMGTGANGCSNTATMTAVENPIYNLSLSHSICQGEVYNFNGQDLTTPGIYTQTLPTVNGCDSIVTLTLTVKDLPTLSISGNTTICEGQVTTLTANGGISYIWSNGSMNASATFSQSGIYTVTATNMEGCFATANVVVTVSPLPALTISGDNSFCQGGNTVLVANGASSYEWSNGSHTAAITINNPGVYTVIGTDANGCSSSASKTVSVTPTYYIQQAQSICQGDSYYFNGQYLTNAGTYTHNFSTVNGCDSTITLTLTVKALPTPSISGNTVICEGQSTTLTATGGNTYLWSDGSTNASVTLSQSGIYTVTATNTDGCSATTSVTVSTSPLPTISISGNTTICEGGSTTLIATGADTYNWSTGDNTATATISVFGIYTVTGVSALGCSNTASVTVLALPAPQITISGETDICAGESTTLTANGGETYLWSDGTTGSTLTVGIAGTYQVIGYNAAGCNAMASATVNVWQPAASEFTVSCPDSCYTWNGTEYCASGDYTQTLQTVHGCDSVVTLHLTITVGIDDHDLAGSVKVFPNPANDFVNVQCTMYNVQFGADLHVFDVYGKLVQTVPMAGETTILNISTLADGMYFVRVTTEAGDVTKPFVVKR